MARVFVFRRNGGTQNPTRTRPDSWQFRAAPPPDRSGTSFIYCLSDIPKLSKINAHYNQATSAALLRRGWIP